MKKYTVLALFFGIVCMNLAAQDVEVFPELGQSSSVTSVAFSPDGKQIISGSLDSVFKLWDVATGREIRAFSGHTDYIHSVAFSPDGMQVLSGSQDKTLKLWDVATGREIRTFSGHTSNIPSVAFSPDGRQVLSGSGSEDTTFKLWDTATGLVIRTFPRQSLAVTSVAFSPDGRQVLSGSLDIMRLWDAATGREIRNFSGHSGWVKAAFSPDGRQIISGADRDNILILWDAATGSEIRTFSEHSEPKYSNSIGVDGKPVGGVRSVAFSPDGKQVLSGADDGTLKLWDVATGQEIRTFSGHSGSVYSVAISPDGMQVLSGSQDRTLKLWEVASGEELRTISGHSDSVQSVAISSDGRQVLGLSDNTLKLWDASTGREIRTFSGYSDWVQSMAFSPDGRQVLSGADVGTLKLWDIATGREIRTFSGHSYYVFSVAFSPDGRQVLSGTGSRDSTLKLWDVVTGREIRTFSGHSGAVLSVAFSPDGRQVLSGSSDNTIKLWDVATGREIRTFLGHSSSVNSVAFSPDGRQVISGAYSYDGRRNLILWDVTTGREIRTFLGHTRYVFSVAFSPDGRQVLSGSSDNTLKLWDVATGHVIRTFSGHSTWVNSVAFSPDGKTIISGSGDGTIRRWETSTGKEIAQFISFSDDEWIVITPDGYYNASPGGDRYINVRVGNDVYGIDQYRDTFYNPLIIEARLQGRSDPVPVTETIQNVASFAPPVVMINNPMALTDIASERVELSVSVVDLNQPIKNIELVVNGRRVGQDGMQGLSGGDRGGFSMASPTLNITGTENRASFHFPVTLSPGKNIIEVIASNGFSQGSHQIEVNCLSAEERLPDLWILSIGVNDYNDNRNLPNLKYAVNDAKEIIDVFKTQEGKLYGKVNGLLIADGEEITPTRENIRDGFDDHFRQAGENDVILLFIAGHGMNDDVGNFYFMPSDAAFNDDGSIRASRVISHRDIQSVLDRPGQKMVFIDTCHSEGTASRLTRSTDNNGLTNQLKNNSTVVFTSSRGNEKSRELDAYEHGAFTWAILEGLRGAAYPDEDDGKITMMGLNLYVSRTVPRLTDRTQNPIIYAPDGLAEFPLAYP